MKRFTAAVLMAAGMLTTGCRPRIFQVSIHAFFEKTEASADVAGRWIAEGDDPDELILSATGENQWRLSIRDHEAKESSGGLVRLGQVGGMLYWDLTAEDANGSGDLAKEHILKLHSVARLRLEEDTLEIAFLDPGWMSKALADGRVDLAHFFEGDGDDRSAVLTAPTADLEAFLQAHGEDPEAFSEPETYHRAR